MMDSMTSCTRSLVLSVILVLFAVMPTMACTVPPNYIELARQLMLQINQERARFHLPDFRMSSQLTEVAQAHACDNASHNRLSHIATGGSSLGARVITKGYDFRFITENVALGYSTHEQVLKAWLQSSSHRKNILDGRTNELGVAVALGRDGRMHWVMNGGVR
ncbi:CAP domain-containing protein [Roseovarius sp. 217]|uniref:CAP domain-containing protein n=1 Tax=Roseovarius sp. (strain 217) TaxID=314264 RepID=UPI0000685D65|nr:CAP domain-containing protein [Roseovarius sp. 217]EAQ26057.1 putative membrane protein [Roseovarius sp. 217]